ncbi:MAG: serine/threonine protein kinase, partial [Planctomycetes bacterium]|nr:serine/threonine protein kinase [Planctomycetota bacterium]
MRKANFDDHYAVLSEALPDYTICRPDADGAQGLLLQAIHNPSQRLVAIKVLLAGPLASREQQDRFRREIEILFDFQHRNIVPTYDCGSVAGRLYYVMPYINGLPVTDWALAYEPTPTRCVALFLEVCDGLSYAHRRGIIHRDVKPSNILVDDAEGEAFGRPYIVDFGLAKKVLSDNNGEGEAFQTRVDQVLGTLPYMSPEQVNGQDKIPDVRSDLYSLGVVFFQVLSGGGFPYPFDVEG